MRQLTPYLRLEVIEQAIVNKPNVGLVIIDGVRDLMYDINTAKESTDLIGKLMEWTDKYQIHIHTVFHLNKSDANAVDMLEMIDYQSLLRKDRNQLIVRLPEWRGSR